MYFFNVQTDLSRRNSTEYGDQSRESEIVVLKERRLVQQEPLLRGVQRLSFLLETCLPGSTPDPHLIAAVLDLVSNLLPEAKISETKVCSSDSGHPKSTKFSVVLVSFLSLGKFAHREEHWEE